jgi:predicted RNase H-like HicB family nuclease
VSRTARREAGLFFAEAPDFPEATAFGASMAEARDHVFSALRWAAEARLRRGDVLPLPDSGRVAADAYAVETVVLLPEGEAGVAVRPG